MYYRHKLDYSYPDRCDEHMIDVEHLRDVNVDEDYPFVRKDAMFGFLRMGYRIIVQSIVFLMLHITHGLKIYGRENIRNNKAVFKNGAITISNHVFTGIIFVY